MGGGRVEGALLVFFLSVTLTDPIVFSITQGTAEQLRNAGWWWGGGGGVRGWGGGREGIRSWFGRKRMEGDEVIPGR